MNSFAQFDEWPSVASPTDLIEVIPNIRVHIINGVGAHCSNTNRWVKLRVPTDSGSRGEGTTWNSKWTVTLKVVRYVLVGQIGACVLFLNDEIPMNVPIELKNSSAIPDKNAIEDCYDVHLDEVLNTFGDEKSIFTLLLHFEDLQYNYEVCQCEIKDFHMEITLDEGDKNLIHLREKKQMCTGRSKSRLQRLENKNLNFSLSTNVPLSAESVQGFVKRINDVAMTGKEKAVSGETYISVSLVKEGRKPSSNDPDAIIYCYHFTANLDPEEFYDNNPGKELYTSDKASPENNVFVFNICASVDGQELIRREVYKFKTKSKEYTKKPADEKLLKVMQLEATRAHIQNLSIERMTTRNGDIAYSWHLLNVDTVGKYEEGDVVGVFPDPVHHNDKTYVDFLTPENYRKATLAGVITRSYYLTANSQEDGRDGGRPSEKICMVGKIKIKVSGAVKHGDFVFASNKLPGVAVTESQLISDKGDWKKKRLLGCSIESSSKPEVKLVTCIVSILLCINNDQVEELLNRLETSLSAEVDEKLREFRDDVDIIMGGISEIVQTTQMQARNKRKASVRRNCRVCFVLLLFFLLGILCCYLFLSPTSPYIKWKCRQRALDGTISFEVVNRFDEDYITMEGILYDWITLKHKLDLEFRAKANFTGSYYLNLRKCEGENLRKVLGWFSNPPVYCRAQVFAATCDCKKVFHHQKYHSWREYKDLGDLRCEGLKGPSCNKTREMISSWRKSRGVF